MSVDLIKNSKILKDMHFVFVIDESGSMSGPMFEGI